MSLENCIWIWHGTFFIPLTQIALLSFGVKGTSGVPHLLHGKFLDLFECPRGTPLETHFMDVLVDVDDEFSSRHLPNGRMVFFPLHSSFSEPFNRASVGKEELKLLWERESSIDLEHF